MKRSETVTGVRRFRLRSFRDRIRRSETDTPNTALLVTEGSYPAAARAWKWSDPEFADSEEFSDGPEDDDAVLMAHVRSCKVDGFCYVCQCL